MVSSESNDDLEDAWRESKIDLIRGLIATLNRLGKQTNQFTAPDPRLISS
jgi:hypothetical protein